MEGTLDTTYISSFGKGTPTLVSNTNTSMATEEGEAQGQGVGEVVAGVGKQREAVGADARAEFDDDECSRNPQRKTQATI